MRGAVPPGKVTVRCHQDWSKNSGTQPWRSFRNIPEGKPWAKIGLPVSQAVNAQSKTWGSYSNVASFTIYEFQVFIDLIMLFINLHKKKPYYFFLLPK